MTDLQAALGTSQMKHIEGWIERRNVIADAYDEALRPLPLILPRRSEDSRSALHLYVVQLDQRGVLDRMTVFLRLRAAGIGVNVHYIPVHTQPYYRTMGFRAGDFPMSEAYYARCMSLPMYAGLSDEQQCQVVSRIKEALK